MTLHYDYFSGYLYSVETSLKKSVAVYTRKYYRVKIGITNPTYPYDYFYFINFHKFTKTLKTTNYDSIKHN
jgi:hypothetical protein